MELEKMAIGIDGGGTHTRAWLLDAEGQVRGKGSGGGSFYHDVGEEGCLRSVDDAVAGAFESAALERGPVGSAFLGMAGVVSKGDHTVIRRVATALDLAPEDWVGVDHDIRIALSGGMAGGPGIALIGGTGSSCYGRTAEGKSFQCGGWGDLADDAGSASWIGIRALQISVRQADGRLPESPLKQVVFDSLGISNILELMHTLHSHDIGRADIAAICPKVIAAMEAGDDQAKALVDDAIRELCLLVRVTAETLMMPEPNVVFAGGMATSGEPFQPQLENAVREALPAARFREAVLPPVAGACLEALKLKGCGISESIIQNLKETYVG